MADLVDLRCPDRTPYRDGSGRLTAGHLLSRLRLAEKPAESENVVEIPCDHCRRMHRRKGRHVRLVVHCYDFAGRLTDTIVVEGKNEPG